MSVNTYLNGSLVNAATTSHIQTGPADQASVLPEASSTLLNRIIQYTGTTTSNYINGYFYKCVQISDDPVTYGWVATQIKPAQTAAETPYESSNVQDTIDALLASIGYNNDHVIGLEADFKNSTFRRLGGAKNKSAGSDFNVFNMYGQRKLCNVADDGTITAWYGDPNYTETGYTTDPQTQQTIQVQVMVRQPKFWYKVVPVELEEITSDDPTQTGVHGYSGVRMKYYIADRPIPGFKVHPAFFNAQGQEVDCYYIGAYEACLFDTSENEYRLYDTWAVTYNEQTHIYSVGTKNAYLADKDYDKLSSIAGAKPASGDYSTDFTRPNVNTMAQNRGTGWGSINIKMVSAEQLLMAIEYGGFNSQNLVGEGIDSYADGRRNMAAFSGSTNTLGNGSGSATSTVRLQDSGTLNTYTSNGYLSVKYRGVENLWGNILAYVSGINIYGDGTTESGEAYICDDFNFAESKNVDNYKPVGFTLPYCSGDNYIKYFGYSDTHDWIFIPSKMGGTSAIPIGDSLYTTSKLNAYRIAYVGGRWSSSLRLGAFYWALSAAVDFRDRTIGARLIKV